MSVPAQAAHLGLSSFDAGRRGMLFMTGFVVLWALVEMLAAAFLLGKYSAFQVVWARYAVHLVLMFLVWGRRDPGTLWRTRRPAFHLARSLLMFVMPASWIVAMSLGARPGAVMNVFWLSPLFIIALSWLLLRERPHVLLWLAGGVALCGACLLQHLQPVPLRLLLFPLTMALSFSLYAVMTRSLRDEPMPVNLFYTALGVFLVLTPVMPWLWRTPSPGDALVMVAVGVLGWFTLWALDRAAAAAPLAISAPFIYLQLLVIAAITVASGLPHEVSLLRMALGTVLIGCAALVVWLRVPRES